MGERRISIVITGDATDASRAFAETERDAEGFGGKLAKLGPIALAAGAAIATAAAGAALGLFKIGESFDTAYDTIRVGTGKTGTELDGLKETFRNVVSDVPADFDTASKAIAEVSTRLNLSGEPLEKLSGQFLNLARITGTDVSENITAVSRAFGDWSINANEQSETLDKFFRVSQSTGISVASLAEQVTQFGAPLRGLGLDFNRSIGLLGKWNKEGVNVENVMGAMKKAFGEFSKEYGAKAPEEFQRFIDKLAAMPDAASAAQLAIAELGVRNGPDFAAAVQEGRFALGDLYSVIYDGRDTINGAAADTEDFGEKWTRLKNQVFVALEPVASGVFDSIGQAMDRLGPKVQQFVDWFETTLAPAAEEFGTKVSRVFADIETSVSGFGETLNKGGEGGGISAAFDSLGESSDRLEKTWAEQWGEISDTTDRVTGDISEWIDENRKTFEEWGDDLGPILEDLTAAFADLQEAWTEVTKTANEFFLVLWDAFGEKGFRTAIIMVTMLLDNLRKVAEVLRGITQIISGVITGDWSRAWEGLQRIVSVIWNHILETVDHAITLVSQLIRTTLAGIAEFWNWSWNLITEGVPAAFGRIVEFTTQGVETVLGVVQSIPGRVASIANTMFNAISENAGTVATMAVNFFAELPGRIMSLASTIANAAREIGRKILEGIGDGLSSFGGFVSGIGTAVAEAAKKAVNWVIGKVNRGLEFTIPIPFGKSINVNAPDIPLLAQGGIVTRPTLAVLGDNPSGMEAVIPLERAGAMGFGGNTTITNNFYGTKVSARDVADELLWAMRTSA
jgi:phage-related protein